MELLLGLFIFCILPFLVGYVIKDILLVAYDAAGKIGLFVALAAFTLPLVWIAYECLVEFPLWQQSCFEEKWGGGNPELDCESAGDMFVYMFGFLSIFGLVVVAISAAFAFRYLNQKSPRARAMKRELAC